MSVLPVGFASASGVDTGDIGHSLRCRSAASAYLYRAPTSSNTTTVFTLVYHLKIGIADSNNRMLAFGYYGANDYSYLSLNAGVITLVVVIGGMPYTVTASGTWRDPTGHYQLVVGIDTTQATATDRYSFEMNGQLLSQSGTPCPQNTNLTLTNQGSHQYIGTNQAGGATNYFDGYFARLANLNGSKWPASNFGYQNSEINEWVPKTQAHFKSLVDAGGTGGYLLDFDDGSSLTTLGYDKSTKGNNWTLNNISLTAGSTYDWMLDVPGNSYATLNPLDRNTNTLPDGNLSVSTSASTVACSRGTMGTSSGKWYWEWVASSNGNLAAIGISLYPGANADTGTPYTYQADTGNKDANGSSSAYGATYTNGDVIGVVFDADAGSLAFYKNNTSQGTAFTGLTAGTYFPFVTDRSIGSAVVGAFNFGQRPFAYTPPTGFKALCQANLPTPAILNPKLHFDVRTRTGTAATYAVTDLLFPPDLAWIKSRGRAVDHALYDSVRGVQKQLESNQTDAETTETTGLTAFNANGYTGGALDQINGTTATNSFVDWLWKAGGAAVTNNAGSISSQVSANVLAGFSIVTYTGNFTAGATVGHGLGKAPSMIIIKNRDAAYDWPAFHTKAGSGNAGLLNLTNAFGAASYFNGVAPGATTFALGAQNQSNQNASKFVAYCFADIEGFSKAFSYTGNGNVDGPFVPLGFKPKFILIKSAASGQWEIFDGVRDPYNANNHLLIPSSSAAEEANNYQNDFLSNGFKPRLGAGYGFNDNGVTYVGIAFADVTGKYSLAR